MGSARLTTADVPAGERPAWFRGMRRGFACRCPACGEGRLFPRFLKVAPECKACGAAMHHHRADDLPPYLVIFVVGHIVGYGIFLAELYASWPLWLHIALWPTLTVAMSLALLQPMKGAVVGLQYSLGMHGFGEEEPVRQREDEA